MQVTEINSTNQTELKSLLDQEGESLLSIVFPTETAGPDIRQNSIRFKNMLNEAESVVKQLDTAAAAFQPLLTQLHTLESDLDFWSHQTGGFALYANAQTCWFVRVPYSIESTVMLGNTWYLRPIFPLLQNTQFYWVLAITLESVQLWKASEFTFEPFPLPEDVPTSLRDAIQIPEQKRAVQFHTSTGSPGSGTRAAQFHGGPDTNAEDAQYAQYCQRISQELQTVWHQQPYPVVLVIDETLLQFYQRAEKYTRVLSPAITQHPASLSTTEIARQARQIVDNHHSQEKNTLTEQVAVARQRKQFDTELASVLLDAYHGRVDTIWLTDGYQQWGKFLPKQQTIIEHSTDHTGVTELLNLAGVLTLRNGGNVITVTPNDLPLLQTKVGEQKVLNALLRY